MKYPLIMFDLDGTLAESKQPIKKDMAQKLTEVLANTKIAVMSGGALVQLTKQVFEQLSESAHCENLYLLPTSGASLYEYKNDTFKKIYEERLSEKEANEIESAIIAGVKNAGVLHTKSVLYGKQIENRGSQITFSALGQKAPVEAKRLWDPTRQKKEALQKEISALLTGFTVAIGGLTSIDITKDGIDKAYGVHKLCERLGVKEKDALYIGDELKKGGNDSAVFKTEIQTKPVDSPAETLAFLTSLLESK